MWDSSFRVGCGAAKCDSVSVNGNNWRDATILVCNYGPAGNVIGRLKLSKNLFNLKLILLIQNKLIPLFLL